jgi:ribonuclease HI
MARDSELLQALARGLDVEAVLREHGVHKEDLQAALARAASALSEETPAGEAGFTLYTDGAARGNPGPAGAGFVIYKDGRMLEGQAQYLGETTNNQAEYNALILGLTRLKEIGAARVAVRSDSELMVKQMRGEYRVKSQGLMKLVISAQKLARGFKEFSIEHIPREQNREADRMSNRAIDEFEGE